MLCKKTTEGRRTNMTRVILTTAMTLINQKPSETHTHLLQSTTNTGDMG